MGSTEYVNAWTLRMARVRLDVYCMMLFRLIWTMMPDHLDIFLYIDSSPQLKGNELFGVTFELYDRDGVIPWGRRHMPFIALRRGFLDAAGKALAHI